MFLALPKVGDPALMIFGSSVPTGQQHKTSLTLKVSGVVSDIVSDPAILDHQQKATLFECHVCVTYTILSECHYYDKYTTLCDCHYLDMEAISSDTKKWHGKQVSL